ncbi:MAG: hypothetical protein U0796_00280 [Gemmatales bacterium]
MGFRTTTVYDQANQPVSMISPLLQRNTMVYDGAGRVKATINPLNFRTSYLYDSEGRQSRRGRSAPAGTRRCSTRLDR